MFVDLYRIHLFLSIVRFIPFLFYFLFNSFDSRGSSVLPILKIKTSNWNLRLFWFFVFIKYLTNQINTLKFKIFKNIKTFQYFPFRVNLWLVNILDDFSSLCFLKNFSANHHCISKSLQFFETISKIESQQKCSINFGQKFEFQMTYFMLDFAYTKKFSGYVHWPFTSEFKIKLLSSSFKDLFLYSRKKSCTFLC